MKKLLLVLGFGLIALTAKAQAKIEFAQDTIHYGTIEQGSDKVRFNNFKNTGNQPLIITNAIGSCGCTVPSYPKNTPIEPGKEGEFKVTYDTNRVGRFIKRVTVQSNADTPSTFFVIEGTVTAKQ